MVYLKHGLLRLRKVQKISDHKSIVRKQPYILFRSTFYHQTEELTKLTKKTKKKTQCNPQQMKHQLMLDLMFLASSKFTYVC